MRYTNRPTVIDDSEPEDYEEVEIGLRGMTKTSEKDIERFKMGLEKQMGDKNENKKIKITVGALRQIIKEEVMNKQEFYSKDSLMRLVTILENMKKESERFGDRSGTIAIVGILSLLRNLIDTEGVSLNADQ